MPPAPSLDTAFPLNVSKLTITVAADDWNALHAESLNLVESAFGKHGGSLHDAVKELPQRLWIDATIEFEGEKLEHVGLRCKGKSSLVVPLKMLKSEKLPFKLDFDRFEDQFPETKNRKFHRLKSLMLANNLGNFSHAADAVVADLIRAAGLPYFRTALYEITLVRKSFSESNTVNLGLYTAVEPVDDSAAPAFFGPGGTLYEAGDVQAASLVPGLSEDALKDAFEPKSKKANPSSDLLPFYNAFHSPLRTSDPAAWRAALEARFDVKGFLRWLALSVLVDHTDTYGSAPHNYYLHFSPDGLGTFVSWDHNLTLKGTAASKPDKSTVDPSKWPLIAYLIQDDVYSAIYREQLKDLVTGVAAPDRITGVIAERTAPIRSKLTDLGNAKELEDFEKEIKNMYKFVNARAEEVEAFLSH